MAFDPNAPISVLDPAPAPAAAAPKATTFDPNAPVEPEAPAFDPTAPVDPEPPYVTKIRQNTDLTEDEKQARIDAFNQGRAKFDFNEPVTPIERYGLHVMKGASDTLPALAVKAGQEFMDQPFQAQPLPLRLAQARVDALQREKDLRAGKLGDALGDPSLAEYPDATLDQELAKAQGRVQKFMSTPGNAAAIKAEQTRLAQIQAQKAGEEQSWQDLPAATGPIQKTAAMAGELVGGATDPTNFIPVGEAAEGAGLARRLLTTGKNLAGQTATLEPIRQTLAVGANQPDQAGVVPGVQRVASSFVGGMVLQGGSELVGTVAKAFKGVKSEDIAGKTAAEAVPVIAAKTGQDPAVVQDQLGKLLPAPAEKTTMGTTGPAVAEKPVTDTLSLNPEDKTVAIHPDTVVEPASAPSAPASTAAPKHTFFDPSGPVDQEVPIHPESPVEPLGPQEGDQYQYTVQRPQPHPADPTKTIPGYTQVDVIRNGDSVRSSTPEQLRAEGHDIPDVPDHLPQGQYSLDQVKAAAEPAHVASTEPEAPAPAPQRGLIAGSPLHTWADQVVSEWAARPKPAPMDMRSERGAVNTGAPGDALNIFAARVVQMAARMEQGVTDFARLSKEMLDRYGEEIRPHLENIFRAAQVLHEQKEHVPGASPDDVKELIGDFNTQAHIDAVNKAADTPNSTTRSVGLLSSILHNDNPDIRAGLKKEAGESAPVTSALSEESGNALVRYASEVQGGKALASSHAGKVLGDHLNDADFAKRLGATLVEDRLRAIKTGLLKKAAEAAQAGDRATFQEFLDHANNVTTMIGKEDSPFKTAADYDAALKDPEIQAAIQRHKDIVQPIAQQMHSDLGGKIAQPGIDTGAFVNLEPLDKEGESVGAQLGGGARKGDLTTPLNRGSAHGRQAFGTADNYETNYNDIARRMITGNYAESAKRQLYDQLQKDGLAVIMPSGKPPLINGLKPEMIPVERRALNGQTVIRNMWVDPRIYPEVIRGMNLDRTFKNQIVSHLSNAMNWLQVRGPVTAIFHMANLMSSIAGSQGGKTVLSDLARKVYPAAGVVDALARIYSRARDVVANNQEVRDQLAKISQIGAGRAGFEGASGTSRLIQLIDKSARLVRNDMFDNLVKRGMAVDTEANRREFINQVGQYNPRLMGQISSKLKEWGFSPFVVAGQTFNRQALRRVSATPGVKAASTSANIAMRAVELGSLASTLFAVPMAINYGLNGKAFGRPGTPLGAIDTGHTDSNGKAVIVDPLQWTGLRRGMRITGAEAAIQGVQRGEGLGKIADNATRDIVGGFVHPYAGPLINAGITATTGYNASLYKQAQTARGGQSQIINNAWAALKQLNPLVGNAIQGASNGQQNMPQPIQDLRNGRFSDAAEGVVKGALKPVGEALGIKPSSIITPEQQVRTLAAKFNDSIGKPRDFAGPPSPYSPVTTAIRSGDIDEAKKALDDLVKEKAAQVQGNYTDETKLAIAKREIAEYYRKEALGTFTGSLKSERQFKASLTGDDATAYAKAREDRRDTARSVRSILYGH
jgi:hypothetical protein